MENQATENTAANEAESKATAPALTRTYFGSDNLAAALEYYNAVAEANKDLNTVANFDLNSGVIPEGRGLVVLPIVRRVVQEGKRKDVPVAIMLASVPDVAEVMSGAAGEKAQEFALEQVATAFMNKLASSQRPDNNAPAPYQLADFIQRQTAGSELSSYNAVAKHMVAALKKKGMRTITTALLRQCLESAAFAENLYETVAQDKWVVILDKLAQMAEKEGKDTAIFEHWKATRNEATAEEDDIDLDLDDLDL